MNNNDLWKTEDFTSEKNQILDRILKGELDLEDGLVVDAAEGDAAFAEAAERAFAFQFELESLELAAELVDDTAPVDPSPSDLELARRWMREHEAAKGGRGGGPRPFHLPILGAAAAAALLVGIGWYAMRGESEPKKDFFLGGEEHTVAVKESSDFRSLDIEAATGQTIDITVTYDLTIRDPETQAVILSTRGSNPVWTPTAEQALALQRYSRVTVLVQISGKTYTLDWQR
ncbi:MAG: hypothetical protein R3E96_00680 [Planctomycetota bacterium]